MQQQASSVQLKQQQMVGSSTRSQNLPCEEQQHQPTSQRQSTNRMKKQASVGGGVGAGIGNRVAAAASSTNNHNHHNNQQLSNCAASNAVGGPPITLPLLHQPVHQSRNTELGVAKTQKTPKHRSSKDKELATSSPLSGGRGGTTIGPFVSIPDVGARKASLASNRGVGVIVDQQHQQHTHQSHHPKTPQKLRKGSCGITNAVVIDQQSSNNAMAQPPTSNGQQSNAPLHGASKQAFSSGSHQQHSAGPVKNKSSQRKVPKTTTISGKTVNNNGMNSMPICGNGLLQQQAAFKSQQQHSNQNQNHLMHQQQVFMQDQQQQQLQREQKVLGGENEHLQGSEKKLSKYDRMIQSLEAVATKQRRTTATNHGSAKKTGLSTEATDPLELRFGALSISSCISKNTGSHTIVSRERLAQLQLYQQQQQMLICKQQIFDRNRPWNCEYCQPKLTPMRQVDKKLDNFSRKCLAMIVSRFMIKEEFYESRKVVELLNTHSRSVLVAQFKDFLIYDDIYEFLTQLYDLKTSLDILNRHAEFYDSLSSLEVLCHYREDQIRDRHLVLHGLKPCYIGLEKQIQAILGSNFRNKLRLVLNQVRKVQIARGIQMEPTVSQESGAPGSSASTPVKSPGGNNALTTLQRKSNSKKKTDFKKLIQSSMVKEYNFSRSQSGLLLPRDVSYDVPAIAAVNRNQYHFKTNSSINFTNISYEGEVQMLKGSVFEDESFERCEAFMSSEEPQVMFNNENIESMYMNAQIILDDLSSRPLTRQSIPKEHTATPASRINMYELHKQEEHKIRLPFCLAPEKPPDQKTCSVSIASLNVSKTVAHNQIKVINQQQKQQHGAGLIGIDGNDDDADAEHQMQQDQFKETYGAASARVNKQIEVNDHSYRQPQQSEAHITITDGGRNHNHQTRAHHQMTGANDQYHPQEEQQAEQLETLPFTLPAPHSQTEEESMRYQQQQKSCVPNNEHQQSMVSKDTVVAVTGSGSNSNQFAQYQRLPAGLLQASQQHHQQQPQVFNSRKSQQSLPEVDQVEQQQLEDATKTIQIKQQVVKNSAGGIGGTGSAFVEGKVSSNELKFLPPPSSDSSNSQNMQMIRIPSNQQYNNDEYLSSSNNQTTSSNEITVSCRNKKAADNAKKQGGCSTSKSTTPIVSAVIDVNSKGASKTGGLEQISQVKAITPSSSNLASMKTSSLATKHHQSSLQPLSSTANRQKQKQSAIVASNAGIGSCGAGAWAKTVSTPDTHTNKRSFNNNRPAAFSSHVVTQMNHHQQHAGKTTSAFSRGTPTTLKGGSGLKGTSPAIKNFNLHQFKMMSNSTRALPTAQQITNRPQTGKKVEMLCSRSKNNKYRGATHHQQLQQQQVSDATVDSSSRELIRSQPRMVEVTMNSNGNGNGCGNIDGGHHNQNQLKDNKVKMSKKLMASIKKDIQVSGTSAHANNHHQQQIVYYHQGSSHRVQQHQVMTDREDIKKEKKRGAVAALSKQNHHHHHQTNNTRNNQHESPVLNPISRQLTAKCLQQSKTVQTMATTAKANYASAIGIMQTHQSSATKKLKHHQQSSASKKHEEQRSTTNKVTQARQRKNNNHPNHIITTTGNAFVGDDNKVLTPAHLPSQHQHLSSDNKRNVPKPSKNQLTLKEQVILEALRKNTSSSNEAGLLIQRSTSGHSHLVSSQAAAQNAGSSNILKSNNESSAQQIKLMRTQTMGIGGSTVGSGATLTQSKSTVVAQKVDLFSIAGKLKLLGQPIQNKNGTLMSSSSIQQQHRQAATEISQQQSRKNTLKFNSRKVSIEQPNELQFSSRNLAQNISVAATQQQKHHQSLRFMSADANTQQLLSGDEDIQTPFVKQQKQHLQTTNKLVKEKQQQQSGSHLMSPAAQPAGAQQTLKKSTVGGSSSKRKLIIPTTQQPEAFYSQRNRPTGSSSVSHQQPTATFHLIQTGGNAASGHSQQQQQMIHSRNGAQALASESCSLDQRQVNQLQMVTKTLNELQKLQSSGQVAAHSGGNNGLKRGNSSSINHHQQQHHTMTASQKSIGKPVVVQQQSIASQPKSKKIQKLSRACTGSIVSPTKGLTDGTGLIDAAASLVSPRNKQLAASLVSPNNQHNSHSQLKDETHSKSRNNLTNHMGGTGKANTQSQQRVVTFHQSSLIGGNSSSQLHLHQTTQPKQI